MKNRVLVSLVLFIVLTSLIHIALAGSNSDEVFDSASVFLSSTKTASFNAETTEFHNSIMVTQVCLYKKIGNTWIFQRYLPAPTTEATNLDVFTASMDYSSYIGTGTYRIHATFTADGHSISRYSNTITY